LLKDVAWLQNLGPKILDKVVSLFQTKVFTVGEKIIRQSHHDDGFFFIARGTVKVTVGDKVVDILPQGNFIGEIAGLTGLPRAAEVTAESPVTLLYMSSLHMNQIMKESPLLEKRLWKIAGSRLAENLLGTIEPYSRWRQNQIRNLLSKGEIFTTRENPDLDLKDKVVILLVGKATLKTDKKKVFNAPALIEQPDQTEFSADNRIFVC
jgi:signal-transduction protein with cAMP-binding, CBS, and nucleotidyltransferase domain